jgi:5-methyltetrahydropteroyltriglutamate--homocysteine methyltransferase
MGSRRGPGIRRARARRVGPGDPGLHRADHLPGSAALEEDIKNLKSATEKVEPADVFMTAASPGVIAIYLENQHYGTTEEYWQAIAEAMRVEYEAIVAAGFILQLDAPDLAMGRHVSKELLSVDEFRRQMAVRVELLNHACRNIPSVLSISQLA